MANPGREIRRGFGVARFEERQHPRFLLNLPIEYYPAKSKNRGIGHTGNASEGGLVIHLDQYFRVGQLMKLKLFFSSGLGLNTIETFSQVIWAEKLEDAEYRCGVKFIDISPEDLNKLSGFLKNLYQLLA